MRRGSVGISACESSPCMRQCWVPISACENASEWTGHEYVVVVSTECDDSAQGLRLGICAISACEMRKAASRAGVPAAKWTGHAAAGGFAGAAIGQTISFGIKRSCYSGDVGVGYASVIHSESEEKDPRKQASLAIFGIFLDTFVVCTLSFVIVLFTQMWKEPIEATFFVQKSLEQYFYGVQYYWPFFLFLLGFSTIIAFFAMGMKSAYFLFGEKGRRIYYYVAGAMFLFFAYFDSSKALLVMEVSGGCLLFINLLGFCLLRNEIEFKVPKNF